jgi:hypothetical protein
MNDVHTHHPWSWWLVENAASALPEEMDMAGSRAGSILNTFFEYVLINKYCKYN